MRESGGTKVAHVRLAGFTSGAHGEVRKAIDRLLERRAPRASCSTCATTAAGCSTRRC